LQEETFKYSFKRLHKLPTEENGFNGLANKLQSKGILAIV